MTYHKILQAAQQIFVKKGFAGATISEIAKTADIHQSLIYHHFGNKAGLWKSVKISYLFCNTSFEGNKLEALETLEEFLNLVVTPRFKVLAENPDMLRILNWQKLEENPEITYANTPSSSHQWSKILRNLQSKKEVRSDLDPDLLPLFITSAIAGVFNEPATQHLKIPLKKLYENYHKMLIDCLRSALQYRE